MFAYPEFDNSGIKVLTSREGLCPEMLMDITVRRLAAGEKAVFFSETDETAFLLLSGTVRFISAAIDKTACRKDVFSDLPVCLHTAKGKQVEISCLEDAEFMVIATENARDFETRFYDKTDIICTVSSEGIWENTAVRDVNTVFDYDNAPYSNLVVGEVIARQGRWWSYAPHSHPQPEVYYYKMHRKEGFGACFIDDEAHTVKDGSVGCFSGGKTHVQVTAPCFPMYCCWMIRHLDGDPWLKTRNVDPRYAWVETQQ